MDNFDDGVIPVMTKVSRCDVKNTFNIMNYL